ncbi:MFS transporter [Streptomyces sp. CB00455]|uniref:MFS transporter n=1 Tax=Streptomyces sp. CB00455 TaxID=1703927 RepID=UPI000A979DF4|nr:MFS transporter [Streptomyces sp. CB00455]
MTARVNEPDHASGNASRMDHPADASAGSRWGLLADRDFRLLWAGQTISKAGSSITTVALPLVAVVELNASPLAVGLLTAAIWVPWLVLGLPAGVWVGRLPRRRLMITCDVVMGLSFTTVPVAAWLHALTMVHLMVVAMLSGIASVFFSAAYQVYLPELVSSRDLIEANAKLQGSASVAQVAGPGVGGLAAQAFGAVSGLLADAATFIISATTLVLMRRNRAAEPESSKRASEAVSGKPAPGTGKLRTDIADGFRFIVRDPYLRTITAFGAAANLALTAYQSIVILYLVRELHVGAGLAGPLAAVGALGGVVGAAVARPLCRCLGTARGVVIVQLAATPFAFLIPLASPGPGIALFVLGSTVLVAGVVAGNVVFASFRQAYAPPEMLSRLITFAMTINHSSIPLGGLLGGGLGTLIGLRATLWTTAAMLVAACGILLAGPIVLHRDLPTAPKASAAESA